MFEEAKKELREWLREKGADTGSRWCWYCEGTERKREERERVRWR